MIQKASEKNNFSYFLASLLLLLFASALFDQISENSVHYLIEAAMILTIVIFIWSIKSSKAWVKSGIGIVITIVGVVVISRIIDIGNYIVFHLILMVGFYLATIHAAAKLVLFTGEIDSNSIIGAICIYLLLGMVWGFLYMLQIAIWPHSFKGLDSIVWFEIFSDIMYFSFVTLTTLGYGDITPITPVAKFFVYLQTIVGQFYIAIFVASIISISLAQNSTPHNPH